jgi:hypothetical protein
MIETAGGTPVTGAQDRSAGELAQQADGAGELAEQRTDATHGETPPDDAQALARKIERTREELGQTVEALAAKADLVAGAALLTDQSSRHVPETPTALSGGSWLAAGKRSVREFSNDFLQDRAAALTYYGVLALFPALLVLVSLLGLVGKSATQPLITSLTKAAPSGVRHPGHDGASPRLGLHCRCHRRPRPPRGPAAWD